jgi:condensin-2 complex subunit H2
MDADARFSALIKPIRDLAQNWDIDIAHTLEDYLEELDDIRLPVAGHGNLNFAEAALLIQGSTTIYSRKVEHLHNLVFQALELISSNKEGKVIMYSECCTVSPLDLWQEKTTGAGGHQQDEDSYSWGDDPSFLMLDDVVIAGASNIDITPDVSLEDGNKKKTKVYDKFMQSNIVTSMCRQVDCRLRPMCPDRRGLRSP